MVAKSHVVLFLGDERAELIRRQLDDVEIGLYPSFPKGVST